MTAARGSVSAQQEKRHLSASQIEKYLRCARQWAYQYVDGIKTPPSGEMILGIIFHSALELNYRQKIETRADLPLTTLQARLLSALEEKLAEFGGPDKVEWNKGMTPASLLAQAGDLLEAYYVSIIRHVQPAAVEQKFVLDLGEDFPFTILGFIDLIEEDGTIVDHKTYSRQPSQDDVDGNLQLSIYSLARRALTGAIEPGLRLDCVIKTKTPKAVQLSTTRDNADARWTIGLIEEVARGIIAEVYPPNPNGWWCSKKMCGYWDMCRGAGHDRKDK